MIDVTLKPEAPDFFIDVLSQIVVELEKNMESK